MTDAEIAEALQGDPERKAYAAAVELQLRVLEEVMCNHRWWRGPLSAVCRRMIANTRRNMSIVARGQRSATAASERADTTGGK